MPDLSTACLSTAWWLALCAFDPNLTYACFLGMTGGVARTVFCGSVCSCREQWEAEQEIPPAVQRMGYRVAVVKEVKGARGKGWRRLLRALDRGRPAVWFDDATAGILTAYNAAAGTFAAARVTAPGAYQAAHVSLEEL